MSSPPHLHVSHPNLKPAYLPPQYMPLCHDSLPHAQSVSNAQQQGLCLSSTRSLPADTPAAVTSTTRSLLAATRKLPSIIKGDDEFRKGVGSLSFKRRARRGEETSEKKRNNLFSWFSSYWDEAEEKKEEKGFSVAWLLFFGLKKKTREKSEIGLWRGSKKDSLFFSFSHCLVLAECEEDRNFEYRKEANEGAFVCLGLSRSEGHHFWVSFFLPCSSCQVECKSSL